MKQFLLQCIQKDEYYIENFTYASGTLFNSSFLVNIGCLYMCECECVLCVSYMCVYRWCMVMRESFFCFHLVGITKDQTICLPTTLGILLVLGQLIKVDTNHGFTQVFRDFSQDLGILKVGNSLDCKRKGWEKLKPNLSIYQHHLPMAFARLAGSPDLKIPEPTKTPSQPSCYIKTPRHQVSFFF